MNNIPKEYIIYNGDEKSIKDYNKNTICGYKKTEIISALEKTIILNDIQETIFWSSELLASGQFNDKIWEKLFILYAKNINISNPKLPSLLLDIYLKFNELKTQYNSTYELEIRNDQEIRNSIASIITYLTLSLKNNYLSSNKNFPKVSNTDLTTNGIKRRIIARDMKLIQQYMSNEEPMEVKIALNEIVCHLQQQLQQRTSNKHKDIFFWIKWLIKIESKLPNKKYICNPRDIKEIDEIYKTDWTWILWEIIFTQYKSSYRPSSETLHTLKSLYEIYKINYKKSTRTNKMYIIYNAILIICLTQTKQIDWNISTLAVNNYSIWVKVCANINVIYKKIALESNTTYSSYMSSETNESSEINTKYNDGYITTRLKQQQNYINNIIQDNHQDNMNEINEYIETEQEYQQQPQQYQQQYQQLHQQQNQQQHYQQDNYYQHEEGLETKNINLNNNRRNYRVPSREEYNRPIQKINPQINHHQQNYNHTNTYNTNQKKVKNKKHSKKNKKNSKKEEEVDEKTLKIKQRMSYLYLKPPPLPKSSPSQSSKSNYSSNNKSKSKVSMVSDMFMNNKTINTNNSDEIQLRNIIID